MKKRVKKNLNIKAFKAGSYSLMICAISLIAVILVNLIISALPAKYVELDISSNDLYTISDYSKELVSKIDTDVTIYHLATDGNVDDALTTLLSRYSDLNEHIKVEVIDPELTQIASQFTDSAVSENSLIFVSDKRSKVVDFADIYEYSEEMMQYMYYGYEVYPDKFDGESEITSALDFVTTDILPVVYTLTGHGEFKINDVVKSELSRQNVELLELDLFMEKTVPEDCKCLILLSPTYDISEKELSAILQYLKDGGRIFITTLCSESMEDKPNFALLLEEYGLEIEDGMIIEGNQNNYYYSPNYILPTVAQHDITMPISESGYNVLLPLTQSIKSLSSYRSTLSLLPLFETSDEAFIRTDLNNQSIEKSENDISGQFTVGYAIEESVDNKLMKGVVISTPYFLDENYLYVGNLSLFLNSINWMCDLEEKISVVSSKSLSSAGYLEISQLSGLLWAALIIVVIPFVLFVTGIVIFVRRKKR